ncbi:hypothetical protein B0H15DRAFT_1019402 [Mycena belliarum]|uniref:Uncharacterized protein n=1 Tax=Mycena belliarum TaxID=1033014 RepID=A0AAD6XW12_9AGAR|nr:hypothetical protein B0H15DRAFT_1019402 [Mycena belliae]
MQFNFLTLFTLAIAALCAQARPIEHPEALAIRGETGVEDQSSLGPVVSSFSTVTMALENTATCTFRNIALTTTFDPESIQSRLSLDWVLNLGIRVEGSVASGTVTFPGLHGIISLQMHLPVVSSLANDLVFGQDWFQFCRESIVPPTCVALSSGVVDFRALANPQPNAGSEKITDTQLADHHNVTELPGHYDDCRAAVQFI